MDGFLFGNFIGVLQTVIGHPFDTVKTHLQLGLKFEPKLGVLYRGAKYPLYSSCLTNAAMFGLYNMFADRGNSVAVGVLCGALTGAMMAPFETRKISAQIVTRAPMHARGFGWTILRESVSVPVYFESFSYMSKTTVSSFVAGGTAGVLSWLIVYPVDLLKTKAQSHVSLSTRPVIQGYALLVTVVRAFIVNGASLSMYEKYIGGHRAQ